MSESEVKSFINQIAPLIVAEGTKRGYHVFSTVIAQAIIESRYGKSTLGASYHNYFGLKCGKLWLAAGKPSVNLKTKEEYTVGILTAIKDSFRVYPDMASGVAGYYDFIDTKRYANLKLARNALEYAQMLKLDGYATSSSYVNTLYNTCTKYNLEQYDTGEPVAQQTNLWEVGKTYTTQQDLYIRFQPNGSKVYMTEVTENAQKHSREDINGYVILNRGTRVTVQDISTDGNCTWLKIPSGWICGKNSKNIYVM